MHGSPPPTLPEPREVEQAVRARLRHLSRGLRRAKELAHGTGLQDRHGDHPADHRAADHQPGRVLPRRIRDKNAEVALKAFKLDYIGGPREGDIAQAGSLENVGDEAVEFKVKANYSAATYTGEISVLVIAELWDERPLNS